MPRHEEAARIHKAVLWQFVRLGRNGEPKVRPPVEIDVRWVETRRQVVDPRVGNISVDAQAVVDRFIPEGSIIWLGALDDIPGTALTPESGLMKVEYYDIAEDVKGRVSSQEVGMTRFRKRLPIIIEEA